MFVVFNMHSSSSCAHQKERNTRKHARNTVDSYTVLAIYSSIIKQCKLSAVARGSDIDKHQSVCVCVKTMVGKHI